MEVLERLTPYVELVHLLLNTNFTYLTRKLAPSDSLDRARSVRRGKKLRRGAVRRRPVRLCSRHPVRDQNPFRHMLHGAGALERGRLRAHRSLSARAGGRRAAGGDPGVQGVPLGLKEQYGVYYETSHAEPRQGARRTGRTGGGRVRREPCVQRFQQPGYLPGGPVPLSRI